jgi:hypothetical protein
LLQLYFRDPQNPSSIIHKTFSPANYTGGNKVWDVCIVSAPNVIETNFFTDDVPILNTFFPFYEKLQVFFRNRKHHKFSQLLGNTPFQTYLI